MRGPVPGLFLLVVALLASPAEAQTRKQKRVGPALPDDGGRCDSSQWVLVFSDEFDGPSLDPVKWRTYFPYSDDGSDRCDGCRLMGTSNTIFRDELVSLQDGILRLGVRTRDGEWYGRQKQYEGAMIHSIGEARFTYGRFEVRCRIPKGAGLWPAFWGFGGETEIDVFEICGERPGLFKGALHRWGTPKYSGDGRKRVGDLSNDFHDYAVEWEPDGVSWFIDGRLVQYRGRFVNKRGKPLPACDREPGERNIAPYFPRDEDGLNVILDLAVSEPNGFCTGPKRPVLWPEGTAFEVDHVRVYQRANRLIPR